MSLATGSRTQVIYIPETVWGVLPASPDMTFLRFTDESLELTRASLQSGEIRFDRQIADFRLGVYKLAGDIGMELLYGDTDAFLQAALGGTWTSAGAAALGPLTDITVATGPNTFTTIGGNFLTAGFIVGDTVNVTGNGTSGNNGAFTVTTVTATVLTVSQTLTAEASGSSVSFASTRQRLTEGVLQHSFSMEVGHLDISQFLPFAGVMIDTMSLSFKPSAISKVKMGVVGSTLNVPTTSTEAASTTAATTNKAMDSFTGVLYEGGTQIAYITSLDIDMKNQIEIAEVIGDINGYAAFPGRFDVSGKMSAYIPDMTLFNKFRSETSSSLKLTVQGFPTNKTYTFTIPNITYSKGSIPTTQERGIPLDMSFQAILDPTTLHTLIIDKSGF